MFGLCTVCGLNWAARYLAEADLVFYRKSLGTSDLILSINFKWRGKLTIFYITTQNEFEPPAEIQERIRQRESAAAKRVQKCYVRLI